MTPHRDLLTDIFRAALRAVDTYAVTASHLGEIGKAYRQGGFKKLLVVAFGKAAVPMARAVEERLGTLVDAGIAITKYGHTAREARFERITVFEAGHPLPDLNGVTATARGVELLKGADAETLVICLISGGGSALFVLPADGITLGDKQRTTDLLLRAGATINELNAVRKHLSKVKGGRLARIAYPASMISLILSDVIGDPLDVIASGPTAPDESTYTDGLGVLQAYGIVDAVPPSVRDIFFRGAKGELEETPKKGDPVFERVENRIIASNRIALAAAEARARELGFQTHILSSELQGDARLAADWLFSKAVELRGAGPTCLIAGGETTVTVKGNGKGGRNTELALAFATRASGKDIALLSAGTDGTDGPTDAAGAFVDGDTIQRAGRAGINPEACLENNDSYTFFKAIDDLFVTGPTGTNVMDIQVVITGISPLTVDKGEAP